MTRWRSPGVDLAALGDAAARGAVDFAAYADRPVDFCTEVLGVKLWAHQRRTLEALVTNRRVSWRSCHGAGKSVTAACAAIWWVCTHADSLCIITAPSARQVRQVLWRTIRQLVSRATIPPADEGPGEVPELGWAVESDRLLLGLTSDMPEKFVGLHARNVLIIADESSGVPEPIFQALKGSLTGNSRLLLISNPSQLAGEFYSSHHQKRGLYHCLHTSAADVIAEAGDVEGLIDQQYVDELIDDYGEQSAVVSIKVHGDFPNQASDAVIPYGLVEEARARWTASNASGTRFEEAGDLQIGVDPARFGDDSSVLVARRGHAALEPIAYQNLDGPMLGTRVVELVHRLRRQGERPRVCVDTIGIGASVYDWLNTNAKGAIDLVSVNVGEASDDDRYERKRDAVWFAARDWLKGGGVLPPDEKLAGELIAPTFGFSPRQRIKVEPKDETKKRLRRSPDRADAFCLAVWKPAQVHVAYYSGEHYCRRWCSCDGSGNFPNGRDSGLYRRW